MHQTTKTTLVILLTLISLTAFSQNRHVATTGTDTGDCSNIGSPCLTLAYTIGQASAGNTINIATGSYGETISIGIALSLTGTGSPTTTSVTLSADVSVSDFTSTTINVNPGGVIQDGIDLVTTSGTVNVSAATYSEALTINKALTLNGANSGIAASGSRSAESIIDPSSNNTAITISAASVTIDGFQLGTSSASSSVTTGISDTGNNNVTINNNIIYANTSGVSVLSIASGTVTLTGNSIDMLALEDQTNLTNPSFGIFLSSLTGTVNAELTDNSIQDASYGIFGFNLDNSGDPLLISGGTYTGCTKGIEIDNTDGSTFSPSIVTIQNVTMSAFAGPDGALSFPDAQAGIYSFVSGSADDATDDITLSISGVDISGVGRDGTDYSGIYLGDFADDNFEINYTITNSDIHDNLNRGIFVRGENSTANITQCTLSGNGSFPNGSGYSILGRNGSTTTVTNCSIINVNSAGQTGTVAGLSVDLGASLTVSNSSLDNNGNGSIATGNSGSTLNLSGNWLGSSDETTNLGVISLSSFVDFTPWLNSGTDTDGGTAGFQPDLSATSITTNGTQTGGSSRWQEAHDFTDASGTVVVSFGDYNESMTSTKNITFQPTSFGGNDTSLDNLTINGTSTTLTLSNTLLIDNAVTLTDGIIDISSGQLRLGASASDLTETSTSYVTGGILLDARNVGTGSIDFLGASIAAGTDDIGNVTITRNAGATAIITSGNSNTSISVSWDITVDTQPAAGRDVSFTWLSAQDNGKDMTQISVFRNPGSGWSQVAGPFDVSALNPRVVNVTGVTEFSQWSMAQNDAPLPVTLLKFYAHEVGKSILINWQTASEINSSHFEIQRSNNGSDFFALTEIASHQNSQVLREYKWNDQTSFISPIIYYRLKMIDLDGTYEFSDIISVKPNFSNSLQIYPNPAFNFIQVKASSNQSIDHFSVIDIHGRTVSSMKKGNDVIDVSQWISGIYFIKVNVNGVNTTHRIIIE